MRFVLEGIKPAIPYIAGAGVNRIIFQLQKKNGNNKKEGFNIVKAF